MASATESYSPRRNLRPAGSRVGPHVLDLLPPRSRRQGLSWPDSLRTSRIALIDGLRVVAQGCRSRGTCHVEAGSSNASARRSPRPCSRGHDRTVWSGRYFRDQLTCRERPHPVAPHRPVVLREGRPSRRSDRRHFRYFATHWRRAPGRRGSDRLCRLWVAFSATSAREPGMEHVHLAGARSRRELNTISIRRCDAISMGSLTMRVGGMSVTVAESLPRPCRPVRRPWAAGPNWN